MSQKPAEETDPVVIEEAADGQPPDDDPPPVPALLAGEPAPEFTGCVVGIGASAGGLDALERLFGALPADTGAAFVVVQHLSPDHKSMMDNLLARYTAMPVRVAEHDMPLAPNAVYLIPPARTLRLSGMRLQLSPKPEHGLSLPIDVFFSSLAEQCGDRALAVVLSGTGSDGSRGVVAINAAGGFVFVQDVADARFDGMPRSAIATGLADVVASTTALARALSDRIAAPRAHSIRASAGEPVPTLVQPLDGILDCLLSSGGIDFRDYKPSTVLRRIERRMQVLHSASLTDYLDTLTSTPQEQVLLRREMLIPVTRFFREPDVFDLVADSVLPELVAREDAGEPIRVWVAACATGEEAYSYAMLFAEAFARHGRSRQVKIFATDVEPLYLEHAAAGWYADTIAAEVSEERLQRWFVERDGGWLVRPELRQMVIFARHNLVSDPPFTRMDLVSCRNALIYFQPAAQEQVLRRLQYALVPGGHFVQGPSESLGLVQRDFVVVSSRHKVYRLLHRPRVALAAGSSRQLSSQLARRPAGATSEGLGEPLQVVTLGQRLLQQAYTPPSLLVGVNRELLHVYGDGKSLLQFAEGEATLDVLKLLPRELSWAASVLLHAVSEDGLAESAAPVSLGQGDERRTLRMVARRLEAGRDARTPPQPGPVLLSFEPPTDGTEGRAGEALALDAEQQRRVAALERELELTQQSLQATIEELETANEELQATNEELMASNEELQSTNEELQSVNEELYTVNAEYQEKVDVLNAVNADLENVSKAAAIPTLFVDDQLCLTRFTPELAQLFKLRESDRGRSVEDFAHLLDYPELFTDLRRTLGRGTVTEREVQSRDGRWWLARIQPYLSRAPGSTRAVMTFVDVTSLKDSQRLQAVIDSMAEHVAVLDGQGGITMVNDAWRRFAAANGDPDLTHSGPGQNYLKVSAEAALHSADAREAHEGLADVLAGKRTSFSLQYPCHSAQQQRWYLMQVAPIRHPGGGAVVSHVDITPWARQLPTQWLQGTPQRPD